MATLFNLMTGTRKILPVTLKRLDLGKIKVESIRESEFIGTKTKVYNSTVRSSEGKKAYTTQIAFFGIDVAGGEVPDITESRVGVRCTCPAYRFWFSWANKQKKASFGAKFPPYVRVTPDSGIPPKNENNVVGGCKHLWLLSRTLIGKKEIQN